MMKVVRVVCRGVRCFIYVFGDMGIIFGESLRLLVVLGICWVICIYNNEGNYGLFINLVGFG